MSVGSVGRIVGRARGEEAGPTLLVTVAIHGNEVAGARAAERVLARLEKERAPIRGEVVVVAGNVAAMQLGFMTDGDQLFVNPSSMLLAFLLPAFLLGFRVPVPVRAPSAACSA